VKFLPKNKALCDIRIIEKETPLFVRVSLKISLRKEEMV